MTVLVPHLLLIERRPIFSNATEKVQKIRKLIETGKYGPDITKYIPGTLQLVFQGMLEHIDTKEQPAHISYRVSNNAHK